MTSILFLTACADRADVNHGISLDVVPTHYALSFNLHKSKRIEVKNRLDTFLIDQKENMLFGQVEMYVANNTAYKFAQKVSVQLHQQGIDAAMIHITRVKEPLQQRFDYVIRVTRHQVTVPLCRPAQSGDFFTQDAGCYVDGLRWKSMARPETVLDHSNMDIRPSKAL
ncbi:hypothetical protein HWV01_17615 [Moritella sp. 5]|nr:hypothetical protein HWV01_17615 [Moritella sp. 5]